MKKIIFILIIVLKNLLHIKTFKLDKANIFILFLICIYSSACNDTKSTSLTTSTLNKTIPQNTTEIIECFDKKKEARMDILADNRRYYLFGIVNADKKYINLLKDEYHIKLITMSCSVSMDYVCYNNIIDSEFVSKNNKHISDIINF